MSQRVNELLDKVDAIRDQVADVKSDLLHVKEDVGALKMTTARNTESLHEHMRRTDAVERSNQLLQESLLLQRQAIEKKLKPIEVFMDRVKFLGMVLGCMGGLLVFLEKLGLLNKLLHVISS